MQGDGPTPISEISDVTPSGFRIQVHVLKKVQVLNPQVRTTLYLADGTGKIRALGFGAGVARFCEEVEPLTEYEMSGLDVFVDREEMHFPAASQFSLRITEDTNFTPIRRVRRSYNFVGIASLPRRRDLVDVLGVIWRVYDFNPHTCNRDIVLVDSGAAVVLTLWNELGEEFEAEEGSVLAVQLAYICDYYDINLGTCEWTSLEVNPDLLDASDLSLWYKFWGCSDPPDVKKSRSFTYRTGQPLV
ncbi:replication protein A 70 kDa DNA-binding subunit-like isoform X1 [Haemaphysalis longicornis]